MPNNKSQLLHSDWEILNIKPVTHLLIFSRGVRPFGNSLLVAGWDENEERPYLYQCDPSVSIYI